MKMILAALIQAIAYACLLSISTFTDMNEAIWQEVVLIALSVVGVISVWLFGKDGIFGNLAALVLALFVYMIYVHDKDALWIIGLLMIPVLHILEAVAWALTLTMKKVIEQRP